MTLLKLILCFVLPPAAVYLHTKECGPLFWISCVLMLCLHLPGVLFALYVICQPDFAGLEGKP